MPFGIAASACPDASAAPPRAARPRTANLSFIAISIVSMAREHSTNQLVAMVLQGRGNLIFLNACSRCLPIARMESASLEVRLALLHEGLPALAKIGAVHAGIADRLDRLHVAPAFVLQHLRDGELGGLDRERCILRDRLGDAHGLAPELIVRKHALDQPDA